MLQNDPLAAPRGARPRLTAALLAAPLLGWLAGPLAAQAEPTPPSAAQGELLAVRARHVLVAPGEHLTDAVVLVKNGRITAVGQGLAIPEGARVLEGEVVCAGFIDAWSGIGLDARSIDDGRTDAATRATDALDPWTSEHERREAVAAGVLLARVQTGVASEFGGISAVVRNGHAGDALVVLPDATIGAAVGISDRGRGKDAFDRLAEADRLGAKLGAARDYRAEWVEYEKQLGEWQKKIAEKEKELEKDFKKAQKAREKDIEDAKKKGEEHKDKEYKEDKRPKTPRFDAEKDTLARVVSGELPLFVRCDGLVELRALLQGTAPFPRVRLVIVGGLGLADDGGEVVARELAQRRIPVLVQPIPYNEVDGARPAGQSLGFAAHLARLGVDVLLGTGPASTRDLPLMAALAVGHGLDRDAALHALTLGAARALDLASEVGTVEVGKRAELLVLDGLPFTSSGRVRAAVSDGKVVHEVPAR